MISAALLLGVPYWDHPSWNAKVSMVAQC